MVTHSQLRSVDLSCAAARPTMARQKATIAFAAEQAPAKAAQLIDAEDEDGMRAGTQPSGERLSCPSF